MQYVPDLGLFAEFEDNNKSIDELIKDVCSPKGATLEGLKVFEENNLDKIIKETSDACIRRAYELSKLNN